MDSQQTTPDHRGMARFEDEGELLLGMWIKRLGLKQNQVAEDAGIGESYLSQLINDPKAQDGVRWKVLRRITQAMGLTNPLDLYKQPPPPDLTPAQLATLATRPRPPRRRGPK